MSKQARLKHEATYQDVLDAPPGMIAELMGGELHLQPRPALPHARTTSSLGGKIGGPFDYDGDGPGGWWILDEPECHLNGNVLVPDLAGWRRERLPKLPDEAFMTLAPDWVCEVLSPSTRSRDMVLKRSLYAEAGVGHLWFIDPDVRTLEAFALEGGRWVLIAALEGEADVSVPPFDAITFDLAALWTS
jgi:Uma2 family endonuclease